MVDAVLELTPVSIIIDSQPTPKSTEPLAENGLSSTPTSPVTSTMSAGGGRSPEALTETSQLELIDSVKAEKLCEADGQLLLLPPYEYKKRRVALDALRVADGRTVRGVARPHASAPEGETTTSAPTSCPAGCGGTMKSSLERHPLGASNVVGAEVARLASA